MKVVWVAFCIVLLAGLTGCARSRSLVVLLPDADGEVGAISIENSRGTMTVDKPFYAVSTASDKAPASPRSMEQRSVKVKFDHALGAEPPQRFRLKQHLFFCQKSSAELTPNSKSELSGIIRQMIAKPPLEIYVVGHADRVGTEKYNRKLSRKRAVAIQKELIASGTSSKIILISFLGESRPRIDTPDEVEEPRNRRVELILKYNKSE